MIDKRIKQRVRSSALLGMGRSWRALRIPYRIFEDTYDSDDLGDLLIAALRDVSDYPGQYNCRFDEDHTHQNPWYHSIIFEIEGISDAMYEKFIEQVAALGFVRICSNESNTT